jgi:intracellular sulfur oxidation DsrE/DsrF family protein
MMKVMTAAVLAGVMATAGWAEGVVHRVAFHVDENDPQVMNMALNNVENVTSYYESIGDTVIVELVAYGPGLNMFIPGKSPVEDRISTMSLGMENLSFAACGNTLAGMEKKTGKKITLMDEATVVTSGVVRLIELQENDYAYVRP